jgi:acetylornithine deacetylase
LLLPRQFIQNAAPEEHVPLDPVELARTLIDTPSPTDHEATVGELLAGLLNDLGLEVDRQPVAADRFNVLATWGAKPRVLFCSHIDTVPPFYGAWEDDEFLYGRGACDAKGIIAAMIVAGERLIDEGIRDFGYLLLVGEETDSIGAKVANRELKDLGSEVVIVGEPTESRFVRASKGALTATVAFRGVAAHSAYPERGDSAIRKLARAVEAIHSASWGEDSDLGSGTVNVGVVRGGEKANIIPAAAEADLIFRTAGPVEPVRRQLEELIAPFDGTIVRAHGNDPLQMVVPQGEDSVVVAFNTDAPHLGNLGRPMLFGPGSILDAHTANEKISRKELVAAVETYRRLVRGMIEGEIEIDG